MKPGDVVVGVLAGAVETKVRPAVVIASTAYLVERPDVLVGILTTKLPKTATSTDCVLPTARQLGLLTVRLRLSAFDANAVLAAAYSWRQGFAQLSPSADLDAFTLPYIAKLANAMSATGWGSFYKYLTAEKTGMKVYTYPPMSHQ